MVGGAAFDLKSLAADTARLREFTWRVYHNAVMKFSFYQKYVGKRKYAIHQQSINAGKS